MPADDLPKWMAAWRPDPLWIGLPSVSRVDLPLLFAGAEYRASLAVTVGFLKGKRDTLPANHPYFHVVTWFENEGVAHHGAQTAFLAIQPLHRHLCELTGELLKLHAAGCNSQALARLPELHALHDALLEQLHALMPVTGERDS
jgi:hypothetical protein